MLNRMDNDPKYNFSSIWLFQIIASTSWMISVFLYGTFSPGDLFQLIASSAWTVANIITFYKKEKKKWQNLQMES